MPVSPRVVEAYVYGSDAVDTTIGEIDRVLASPAEKHHRRGDHDDWYHVFRITRALTHDEQEQLRAAYLSVGWGLVQVMSGTRPELASAAVVRIYRNRDSRHMSAPLDLDQVPFVGSGAPAR